jgi:hypothetical protein
VLIVPVLVSTVQTSTRRCPVHFAVERDRGNGSMVHLGYIASEWYTTQSLCVLLWPTIRRTQALLHDLYEMLVLQCRRDSLLVVQLLVHCNGPAVSRLTGPRTCGRDAPAFSDWWVPSLTLISTLNLSGRDLSNLTRRDSPVNQSPSAPLLRPQ